MIETTKIDLLISDIYKEIVKCGKAVNDLSYDDTCRRTNREKINCMNTKIECLKRIVKRLQEICDGR